MTGILDFDSPEQPSRQVAAALRRAIESGELPVGEQLRSVRALADEYGVSTNTIQQALRTLRDEGLITTWQGRGSFVRKRRADPPSGAPIAAESIMQRLDEIADRLGQLEARVAALERARTKAQRSKPSPDRSGGPTSPSRRRGER